MRFKSEIIHYPNFQDYIEQIFSSIVGLLNRSEDSVGSIFIGEVRSESDLIERQIEKMNIENLLESGLISPKPTSVSVKIVSIFLEIEVKSETNKLYALTAYFDNQ